MNQCSNLTAIKLSKILNFYRGGSIKLQTKIDPLFLVA